MAAFKKDKSCSLTAPEKPTIPQPERILVQDTTKEALAPILKSNPKGLLLCRDELAGWFGSFNRYSGKTGADEADWLSMHDGDSITVDRKGEGAVPLHVPSAVISIAGGIQPAILASVLTDQHKQSGLAGRILFAKPPRVVPRWTERELSDSTANAMAVLFEQLYGLSMVADEDGRLHSAYIGMNDECKRVFVNYYNEHQAQQETLLGDESAAWAKLGAYVPRFALLVHLISQAGSDEAAPVDANSMTIATKLVDWFKIEAERVYDTLGDDALTAELRQAADWIKRKYPHGVTVAEYQRGHRRLKTAIPFKLAFCGLAGV